MSRTPSQGSISTKFEQIAHKARTNRGQALTTLAHHMDMEWMREAYRRTRKDGAVGVDGQTAQEYEAALEANLQSLLDRAKSGLYKAPPVRRVYIPKSSDPTQLRPLGIPTFEDKVLQRAVAMVLTAVYEQEFLDCSYGFRPGRSAHQALEALWRRTMNMQGGWIVEIDIESFFDSVDHGRLREILAKRVRDGVLTRLIGKWLNAGVMEQGHVRHPDTGTPQGGVISPLLANVFLHEVLDQWFETEVKPGLRSQAHLVRFADDAVMLFAREDEARRVMQQLTERMADYGLKLHPDKTRLVRFERPPGSSGPRAVSGREPGTFDFLGFTHYWGKAASGRWAVKRKTAKKRFARVLRELGQWCRRHRHDAISQQHRALSSKLQGHYGYYGLPDNRRAVDRLWYQVTRRWRKWLSRRSHKARIVWAQMTLLLERFPLPRPRCLTVARVRAANP